MCVCVCVCVCVPEWFNASLVCPTGVHVCVCTWVDQGITRSKRLSELLSTVTLLKNKALKYIYTCTPVHTYLCMYVYCIVDMYILQVQVHVHTDTRVPRTHTHTHTHVHTKLHKCTGFIYIHTHVHTYSVCWNHLITRHTKNLLVNNGSGVNVNQGHLTSIKKLFWVWPWFPPSPSGGWHNKVLFQHPQGNTTLLSTQEHTNIHTYIQCTAHTYIHTYIHTRTHTASFVRRQLWLGAKNLGGQDITGPEAQRPTRDGHHHGSKPN